MKNKILIFLIIISTISYSQTPTIRFEMKDGSNTSYQLNEIQKINFETSTKGLTLKLYPKDEEPLSIVIQAIDSVQFGKDTDNNDIMTLYSSDNQDIYLLNGLDSISFGIINEPLPNILSVTPNIG